MKTSPFCSSAPLAPAIALVLLSSAALAQSGDPQVEAMAQDIFDRAVAELDDARYASACPKLEEVTRLIPDGIGARETLGECYEGMGRLASAWSQYLLAETLARRAGDEERAAEDAALAGALEPRLARLTIEVPEAAASLPGIEIARDRVLLGKTAWATPMAIDPGPHVIEVKVPGRRTVKHELVVGDGAQVTWTVPLFEMEPRAKPAPPAAPPVRPWQRPIAYGAIGVGLAGLGTAGALSLAAVLRKNESNDGHCNAQNECNDAGLALRAEAMELGNGATAALVVGGALIPGAVLLLTAPPPGKSPGGKSIAGAVETRIELSPSGVWVSGAW